jgi:hypothetical protein
MATSYSEKLKDPRWQKMRLEVMNRDSWTCQSCYNPGSSLNVHHLKYAISGNPWDSDPSDLITLCGNCHEIETGERADAEKMLLKSLKSIALSSDLERLAKAFACMELCHVREVVFSAVEYVIKNKKVQEATLEMMFEIQKGVLNNGE